MATYSAFFSSGLLAPRIARCTTPVLPSSPIAIATSPVDPIERHLNLAPAKAPEAHTNAERPRVRRRRSSVNVATSPMALIKSPVRNAGTALQRTGIMSPTRHRAASIGMNGASEDNSLFGRLRSGSVSRPADPPKRARRVIRAPTPLVPPPNEPLPAPPTSPTTKRGSLLPAVPRQPLPMTSHMGENIYPPELDDSTSEIPIQLSHGPFEPCSDTIEEVTMEN